MTDIEATSSEETGRAHGGQDATTNSQTPDEDLPLVYVDTVNPNLICCICQSPFREPLTTPCGHTFCRACLQRAITVMHACPIDRLALQLEDARPADPIVRDIVNELRVQCPNYLSGCEQVLLRQDVGRHLRTGCSLTTVICPNDGCTERGPAQQMETHVKTCIYRQIECDACHAELRALELEDHRHVCVAGDSDVCCPHCLVELPLSGLDRHLDECMDYPLHCRNADVGCDWEGTRRGAGDHLRGCILGKVRMLLDDQRRRQEELEIENARLLERVQQLEAGMATMRDEMLAMSEVLPPPPLHSMPPNHLPPTAMFEDGVSMGAHLEEQQHRLIDETEQIRRDLAALNASVTAVEMKQNVQLATETIRQREEIQVLQGLYQSLAMQLRRITAERSRAPPVLLPRTAGRASGANVPATHSRTSGVQGMQTCNDAGVLMLTAYMLLSLRVAIHRCASTRNEAVGSPPLCLRVHGICGASPPVKLSLPVNSTVYPVIL
ncbi:hypothetical protein THASP1DRAFT_16932 [Thamnocephalis sphaerospora]|uniref:Uncharacterized protein n=1 Tax=Thamnocephalis sphaerospora TaxID=78915 RepID=A0A4P9XNV5_9FUNG|nr:hypothetical protein THASP1DRAFT_16932 [Thamnocephalis sphaerospora]|eukprot:RKP07522.1 hypothetical protein THASP1DRAFT_16932 [Thamnocephalis sphaerospora]